MKHTIFGIGTVVVMAAASGCGGTTRATVAANAVPVKARMMDPNSVRAPERFAAETQNRVDQIGDRLRLDVARGKISPDALIEYDRQGAYLNRLLAQYSSDQYIQDNERDHVRSVVRRMETIDNQYQSQRGGGPQP
jgi:hypothetical protein